ncbi:MAG: ABC transporter permease [Spirochaetales bacterium]|nr:ABC transporter permease [Spirochaetales bacterium]
MKTMTPFNIWKNISGSKLFFSFAALVSIFLFDLIFIPNFFAIQLRDGNLYGNVIDIMRSASTVCILAIGMTLVIATGGVDLSVGAVMAISASVAALMMNPYVMAKTLSAETQRLINDPTFTFAPFGSVIIAALVVAVICGLWNGILVAYFNIPAMVATLILMISGRGIAQLITNGIRIQIFYEPFSYIANLWLIIPLPIYIVAFMLVLTWFLTRKTAMGMFIESVGANSRSSFYSGLDEKFIKLLVYAFCGFCAGVAGLIASSNIKTSDANNIGLLLELDAILAVVIGGNMMSGGRFTLLGSVIGALVMQATKISMYNLGVPANAVMAIQGAVVLFVILFYSKQVREF